VLVKRETKAQSTVEYANSGLDIRTLPFPSMITMREVGVFWDYENLPLPSGTNVSKACQAIVKAISRFGPIRDQRLYFDFGSAGSSIRAISSWNAFDCVFDLVNTPKRHGSKETLDKKLISDVWAYAWDATLRSASNNNTSAATSSTLLNHNDASGCCIVLLSSDGDYAHTLNKLRNRGIHCIVVHGPMESVSSMLTSSADVALSLQDDILTAQNVVTSTVRPPRQIDPVVESKPIATTKPELPKTVGDSDVAILSLQETHSGFSRENIDIQVRTMTRQVEPIEPKSPPKANPLGDDVSSQDKDSLSSIPQSVLVPDQPDLIDTEETTEPPPQTTASGADSVSLQDKGSLVPPKYVVRRSQDRSGQVEPKIATKPAAVNGTIDKRNSWYSGFVQDQNQVQGKGCISSAIAFCKALRTLSSGGNNDSVISSWILGARVPQQFAAEQVLVADSKERLQLFRSARDIAEQLCWVEHGYRILGIDDTATSDKKIIATSLSINRNPRFQQAKRGEDYLRLTERGKLVATTGLSAAALKTTCLFIKNISAKSSLIDLVHHLEGSFGVRVVLAQAKPAPSPSFWFARVKLFNETDANTLLQASSLLHGRRLEMSRDDYAVTILECQGILDSNRDSPHPDQPKSYVAEALEESRNDDYPVSISGPQCTFGSHVMETDDTEHLSQRSDVSHMSGSTRLDLLLRPNDTTLLTQVLLYEICKERGPEKWIDGVKLGEMFKQASLAYGVVSKQPTKQRFRNAYREAWNQGVIELGRKQENSTIIDIVSLYTEFAPGLLFRVSSSGYETRRWQKDNDDLSAADPLSRVSSSFEYDHGSGKEDNDVPVPSTTEHHTCPGQVVKNNVPRPTEHSLQFARCHPGTGHRSVEEELPRHDEPVSVYRVIVETPPSDTKDRGTRPVKTAGQSGLASIFRSWFS
jgi:NYN domain